MNNLLCMLFASCASLSCRINSQKWDCWVKGYMHQETRISIRYCQAANNSLALSVTIGVVTISILTSNVQECLFPSSSIKGGGCHCAPSVPSRPSPLFYSCNSLPQGFFLASGSQLGPRVSVGDKAEMPESSFPTSHHQKWWPGSWWRNTPALSLIEGIALKCVLHCLPQFPSWGPDTHPRNWPNNTPYPIFFPFSSLPCWHFLQSPPR